jgi:transcriptional regulator with XRE-family HTH domain
MATSSGEQIRDARERCRMSQSQLAYAVGVSLRTVGSWERGESVPRSRMGAIREALDLEPPNDNRLELGRLIREELEASSRGPSDIVRDWPESGQRSFYSWAKGSIVPLAKSRARLEDSLGWRRGSVNQILEASITQPLNLTDVRDRQETSDPAVTKASQLTDDELLIELTRRWGAMRERLDRVEGAQP